MRTVSGSGNRERVAHEQTRRFDFLQLHYARLNPGVEGAVYDSIAMCRVSRASIARWTAPRPRLRCGRLVIGLRGAGSPEHL